MRRLRRCGFGLIVAAAGTAGSAAATWTPVDGIAESFQVPSLLRTADGTLHVVYPKEIAPGNFGIFAQTISAAGTLGSPVTIAGNWLSLGQPSIVPAAGGSLGVFWSGCITCGPTDKQNGLNAAVSSDGGASWTVTTTSLDNAGGDIRATTAGSSLQPFIAWSLGGHGVTAETGFGGAISKSTLTPAGTDGFDQNIATDPASGNVYVIWENLGTHVVYAQQVDGSAQPVGSAMVMPGQGGQPAGNSVYTIALAERPGGGVYAARDFGSPDAHYVVLWRIGSPASTLLANIGQNNAEVGDAATADGRIWVFWRAGTHVFARRSNPSVTLWGPVIDAGQPGGSQTFAPTGSALPSGSLDLLDTAVALSGSGVEAFWTRVLPALTVTVSPAKVTARSGQKLKLKFTVRDAGAATPGAKVSLSGHTGTTGAGGSVSLKLGGLKRSTTLTAKVTDPGYTSLQVKVRVRIKH